MYQYSFFSSSFCFKAPQLNKQPNVFQRLLPPDSQLPKLGRQNRDLYKFQDDLNQKNEEIKYLADKNKQLLLIISQKQTERNKINKKYNQLLLMYEQMKNNGLTFGMEAQMQNLIQQNRILVEKIRKLERELVQSEKQIIRKVKFYEQKNEDSRKLLQKLNQNITKRQQKFKIELLQAQAEANKKSQALRKLQEQYHELQSLQNQKQDQLTKILQQTERDRSAFSQNISTIQMRLQNENTRLHQQIAQMKGVVVHLKNENNSLLKHSEQSRYNFEQSQEIIKKQYQNALRQIDELSTRIEQQEMDIKQLQGKYRLLQADNNENANKLKNKNYQFTQQVNQNKELIKLIQQLKFQNAGQQQQIQHFKLQKQEVVQKYNSDQMELQKCKSMLKSKVDNLTQIQFQLHQQIECNKNYVNQNSQLGKSKEELESRVKKLEKQIVNLQQLLKSYKTEGIKIRIEADNKWKQMSEFYEKQILKLSNKLLANSTKNNSKNVATTNLEYFSS